MRISQKPDVYSISAYTLLVLLFFTLAITSPSIGEESSNDTPPYPGQTDRHGGENEYVIK